MPTDRQESTSAEIHALLGRGTEFEGRLVFDGVVRIDGHFKGGVHSDGTLVIGEPALVEAEIRVGVLIVRGGTLRGNIRAKRSVEVHAPGAVFGNITAPEVFIDKGVRFEGQCQMRELEDET